MLYVYVSLHEEVYLFFQINDVEVRAINELNKFIFQLKKITHNLLPSSVQGNIWIESLHSVMLIYAAKRIHYGDDTYNMCMQLAILDWVRNLCC